MSNSTNTSYNFTELNIVSLRSLSLQSTEYLCWVIFSTVGLLTNLLVFVTISRSKDLRNKSQFIILCHSYSEIFFMLVYLLTGSVRYLAYVYQRPETSTQFVCILKQFPLVFGGIFIKCFSLALALDRLICVARPVYYKTLSTRKYVISVNVIIWTYALSNVPFALSLYDRPQQRMLSVCAYATTFDPIYVAYNANEANVMRISTALVYFVAATILFRRYRQKTFSGETQKREWKRQMEFDVFVAVAAIGAIYLGSVGISAIITGFAQRIVDLAVILIISPIVTALNFVSSISHFFVYFKLNAAFRREFKRVVLRRTTTGGAVAPAS